MGTKRTSPNLRVCQEMRDGLTGAMMVKVFPEPWGAPGPTGRSAQALRGKGLARREMLLLDLAPGKG